MSPSVPEFDEFYVAHASRLVRVAQAIVRDRHAAEDVVQTAFARAYAAWWRVRRATDPPAYVRRMVVNAALAHLRRSSYRHEVAVAEHHDHAEAARDESVAARDEMWLLLGQLPPRQRAVVVLRYYEQLSERETAEALGCRPGTVKSQTSAAMRTLRAHLQESTRQEECR